jgi:hypothetical protein
MKIHAMESLNGITGVRMRPGANSTETVRINDKKELSTRNCVAGYPYQAILCKITSR